MVLLDPVDLLLESVEFPQQLFILTYKQELLFGEVGIVEVSRKQLNYILRILQLEREVVDSVYVVEHVERVLEAMKDVFEGAPMEVKEGRKGSETELLLEPRFLVGVQTSNFNLESSVFLRVIEDLSDEVLDRPFVVTTLIASRGGGKDEKVLVLVED